MVSTVVSYSLMNAESILKDAVILNWNDNARQSPYQEWAWARIVAAPRELAMQVLTEYRAELMRQSSGFCPANLAWELSLIK